MATRYFSYTMAISRPERTQPVTIYYLTDYESISPSNITINSNNINYRPTIIVDASAAALGAIKFSYEYVGSGEAGIIDPVTFSGTFNTDNDLTITKEDAVQWLRENYFDDSEIIFPEYVPNLGEFNLNDTNIWNNTTDNLALRGRLSDTGLAQLLAKARRFGLQGSYSIPFSDLPTPTTPVAQCSGTILVSNLNTLAPISYVRVSVFLSGSTTPTTLGPAYLRSWASKDLLDNLYLECSLAPNGVDTEIRKGNYNKDEVDNKIWYKTRTVSTNIVRALKGYNWEIRVIFGNRKKNNRHHWSPVKTKISPSNRQLNTTYQSKYPCWNYSSLKAPVNWPAIGRPSEKRCTPQYLNNPLWIGGYRNTFILTDVEYGKNSLNQDGTAITPIHYRDVGNITPPSNPLPWPAEPYRIGWGTPSIVNGGSIKPDEDHRGVYYYNSYWNYPSLTEQQSPSIPEVFWVKHGVWRVRDATNSAYQLSAESSSFSLPIRDVLFYKYENSAAIEQDEINLYYTVALVLYRNYSYISGGANNMKPEYIIYGAPRTINRDTLQYYTWNQPVTTLIVPLTYDSQMARFVFEVNYMDIVPSKISQIAICTSQYDWIYYNSSEISYQPANISSTTSGISVQDLEAIEPGLTITSVVLFKRGKID